MDSSTRSDPASAPLEDDRRVVAVDLGGTKTTAAPVSAGGAVGDGLTRPTPARRGPEAVLDLVAELVAELGPAPDALAVGTAGVVDTRAGRIVSATDSLPGWPGTEVAAGLRTRLGIDRVHVQNDVDAHAAGEAWLGAGRGAASMFMVAIGTGVGASFVLAGEPLRGAHHLSGEMGHQPVPGAEGLRCGCGREGHLEAIAAGPAIARRYRMLTGQVVDARQVVARAVAGDQLAGDVVRAAAVATGRALAGVITVLDPERVVIGGGLPQAGEVWWRPMERALREELVEPVRDLPLLPAELGQDAALVGAGRFGWMLLDGGRR